MAMQFWAFLCCALVYWSASANGFGGADDRYIKKYAMMKVSTFLHVSHFLLVRVAACCFILCEEQPDC
jgi:hypothetical protein